MQGRDERSRLQLPLQRWSAACGAPPTFPCPELCTKVERTPRPGRGDHPTRPLLPTQQCTHMQMHMHMHARTCTHMHTHAHRHMHAYTCTHTHARIHMHTYTYTYTCTHTHMHAHTHARTCTHMHAHARTCTHMHTHARTHTHTHRAERDHDTPCNPLPDIPCARDTSARATLSIGRTSLPGWPLGRPACWMRHS